MRRTGASMRSRTSRRFSLLGTCGFLGVTIVLLPSAADLIRELRSLQSNRVKLMSGDHAPQRSEELDAQLNTLRNDLAGYEEAMIGVDEMPFVQSELMELARESECQLRKSVGQSGATEDWLTESDEEADPGDVEYSIEGSPYQLSTERLSLSLQGTLEQTFDFLSKMQSHNWLMRVSSLTVSRSREEEHVLATEVNLSFYELNENDDHDQTELIQWSEGPPPGDVQ